jgi:hypothetical protein
MAVTLRGTSPESRAGYFGWWLSERLEASLFDLIITEAPLSPAASKSGDATIAQFYLHGALQGVASAFGVDVTRAPVMTVRKHFCGQATSGRVHWKGHKRTIAEARTARTEINEMVLKRAILLGYLPAESKDWYMANAAALWDFGCAKFARARPDELVMFVALARPVSGTGHWIKPH